MSDQRKNDPDLPGGSKPGDAEEPVSVHVGMKDAKGRRITPWAWIPTAYFAEGIPYIVAMTLSVIAYKNLGISNKMIGFWTSILYLPWVVKPLWGPLVDKYWTKRNWIIWMQLLLGICFAGVAFGMQLPNFFMATLIFLWAVAFLSATHDIACDGFYMLGLSEHQQAWYVGIRSTFYRIAMLAGTGLLPIVAGVVQDKTGLESVQVTAVAAQDPSSQKDPFATTGEAKKLDLMTDLDLLEMAPGESKSFRIRLTKEPPEGKSVTVTVVRRRGDKEIAIPADTQFNFDRTNWNQPKSVEVRAGSGVEVGETAKFTVSAKGPSRIKSRQVIVKTIPAYKASLVVDKDTLEVAPGEKAVFHLSLSAPPEAGKKVVATLEHKRGDDEIRLSSPKPVTFDSSNWNQPAEVVVEADKDFSYGAANFHAYVKEMPEYKPVFFVAVAPKKMEVGGDQQRLICDSEISHVAAGGSAAFHVRLAKQPEKGKEIVVNFSRDGNKNLKIEEGERFVFTDANWDIPSTVTLSAHRNVKDPVFAQFTGRAGNIRLSWLVVFMACAVLFGFFFFYHGAMLPFPKSDSPTVGAKAPIYIPVFWLLVAIGIPGYLLVDAYGGLGADWIVTPLKKWVGFDTNELIEKGWDFFFMVARWLVLGLILWLILKPMRIRDGVSRLYNTMSVNSDIGFSEVFSTFFAKKHIGVMLAFILLYRLGEAQLVKMAQPFMLDTLDRGGLNLTVGDVGLAYGTVGLAALTIGGILGGLAVAAHGLKKWIWWMVLAINVPDSVYIYMAYVQPDDLLTVNICVAIEQLGYGFGFTAYMLYMIYAAQGPYKTAHFALATGFMALGMMIPGMVSGYLQDLLGYYAFFIAVMIFTIPGFLLIPFLPIDEKFGVKEKKKD